MIYIIISSNVYAQHLNIAKVLHSFSGTNNNNNAITNAHFCMECLELPFIK